MKNGDSLSYVYVLACVCARQIISGKYIFSKMSPLHFKQDTNHISEDKNDYFHNLLKHKKAI